MDDARFRLRRRGWDTPAGVYYHTPVAGEQFQSHRRRLLNNKLTRWILYAVICYLSVSALLAPFIPRSERPPIVNVYPATPMQPEAVMAELPIYDSLNSVCLRQTFFLRNSTFLNLPLNILGAGRRNMQGMCLPERQIGAMWSQERGLTMDPIEYSYYRRRKEEGLPLADGLDWYYEETGKQKPTIHHDDLDLDQLCGDTSDLMFEASGRFMASIWDLTTGIADAGFVHLRLWAYDLVIRELQDRNDASPTTAEHSGTPYTMASPCSSPTPDPSPLRTLALFQQGYVKDESLAGLVQDHMDQVFEFRQLLQNATQNIDQVLDISHHLTKDATGELSLWERVFGPDPQTEALRATKASMAFLSKVRHNLTTVLHAVEGVIDEHKDILREESRLSSWVRQLIDDGCLASGAGPDVEVGMVRLPNNTDSFLLTDKFRTNLWAVYRPRLEKEKLGQWCVYPECPPATGESILVRLHIPNPTDALQGLAGDLRALYNEKVALQERMKSRYEELRKQQGKEGEER